MTLIPHRLAQGPTGPDAPRLRPLHLSAIGRVLACACPQGLGPRPREARFPGPSLAIAEAGCFGHHGPQGRQLVGPGAWVLGREGEAYACSHAHGGGDASTLIQWNDGLWPEAWREGLTRLPGGAFLPPTRLLPLAQAAQGRQGPLAADEALLRLGEALSQGEGPPLVPHEASPHEVERAEAALALLEGPGDSGLAELAQALGCSPWHLLRGFQAATGLSPHQARLRLRLRRALQLLEDPQWTITEVALAAGFGELSSFMRAFQRAFGQSPGALRRSRSALQSRAAWGKGLKGLR